MLDYLKKYKFRLVYHVTLQSLNALLPLHTAQTHVNRLAFCFACVGPCWEPAKPFHVKWMKILHLICIFLCCKYLHKQMILFYISVDLCFRRNVWREETKCTSNRRKKNGVIYWVEAPCVLRSGSSLFQFFFLYSFNCNKKVKKKYKWNFGFTCCEANCFVSSDLGLQNKFHMHTMYAKESSGTCMDHKKNKLLSRIFKWSIQRPSLVRMHQ